MAIQSSGQISLLDIYNEFGGPSNVDINLFNYYRGGLYVPDESFNNSIPTSGQISLFDFYGTYAFIYAFFTINPMGHIQDKFINFDGFQSFLGLGDLATVPYPGDQLAPGYTIYSAGSNTVNNVFEFTLTHSTAVTLQQTSLVTIGVLPNVLNAVDFYSTGAAAQSFYSSDGFTSWQWSVSSQFASQMQGASAAAVGVHHIIS